MTIHLPNDLARALEEEIRNGPIADLDQAMAAAVRLLLKARDQGGDGIRHHEYGYPDLTEDEIAMTPQVLTRASRLAEVHALRAYVAVQSSSALDIQIDVPSLIMISADRDLHSAARAEGLPTDDPNTHP